VAAEHLDRLTPVDAGFLYQEDPNAHMHVGALMRFEGPPPSLHELADALRERLHLVPRYRQKLALPPAGSGRPLWVDDPAFDLDYHVRHTALPRPGDDDALLALAEGVFSRALDRSRSLWEILLVEGLHDGGFALVSKVHHAMTDGVGGVDVAQALLDPSPVPADVAQPDQPWRPKPEPTPAEVLADGALAAVRTGLLAASAAADAIRDPRTALHTAVGAAEALAELAWTGLNPAPATPLNVDIGPHRRLLVVRRELGELSTIREALGGTVNDVVLAAVSGALRAWLRARRVRTAGLELRALVPVSVRGEHEHGAPGNRISLVRGPLPVYVEDPLARLHAVRGAMDALKAGRQADGAEILAAVEALAPPALLARASRLQFSPRLFNLLVTNVPGPRVPLYLRGRELLDVAPIAFLPRGHALAVAVVSYHGAISFGLLGDRDALPDLDVIATGLDASLDELAGLARDAAAAPLARPAAAPPQSS
jgi:diacylglycerol O-acyltransferase